MTTRQQKLSETALQSTVIPIGYVEPKQVAASQVNQGVYSLNKRSNVPFVTLRGTAGFQKTISWGEIAEIPAGMSCAVINDSYHAGDIWLSKGSDPCNRPSRITVPVPGVINQVTAGPPTTGYISMAYPCDTRSAKRAYLSINAIVGDVDATGYQYVNVRGRRLSGSMNTPNQLTLLPAPYGPGTGYLTKVGYQSAEFLTMIPLGFGAEAGDENLPHVLLDAADVFIYTIVGGGGLSTIFTFPAYTPEGVSPTGVTSLPSMWYTVEYD